MPGYSFSKLVEERRDCRLEPFLFIYILVPKCRYFILFFYSGKMQFSVNPAPLLFYVKRKIDGDGHL